MAILNINSTIFTLSKFTITICALVFTLALSNSVHAIKYQIIDLGSLGGAWSNAQDINEVGQVTGDSQLSDFTTHAFIFNNGTMQDIGSLTGSSGYSVGEGINNHGQVTGDSTTINGTRAFLYSNGVMQDLGTLGGASSYGRSINDSGQVTGSSSLADGCSHAFLYSGGDMQDIGALGGCDARGIYINNSGQVTGETTIDAGNLTKRAFLYSDGVMQDLGTLGGTSSFGKSINDSGQVTGSSQITGDTASHVFLYSGGVMQGLGTLPGGISATGYGINNNGYVVGSVGFDRAFLYDGNSMLDLCVLTDCIANGWSSLDARAINDRGDIVGFGLRNGDYRGFLAKVDTDGDGVADSEDNCTEVTNPDQRDTDGDDYGNICDPDFDNNLIVGAADLAYFKSKFFTADADADMNGDSSVNGGDLAILKGFFFQPPGPSYIDMTTTETGILFDSPVSGVNYNTATQSGVTDVQGNYSYLPGETVTFSIGDIAFPTAKATQVFTPLNMVGKTDLTDTSVINITRLLQSLDVDGDPFNGIEISTAAHTAATGLTVDFQSPTFDTDVANLVANSGSITTTLIDQATAIDNFKLALSTLPIDWESYYNYADNRQWNYTVDLSWISTFYDYTVNSNINGEDVYIHGWDPSWDPEDTKEYILRDMSSGVYFIGIQINGVDEFFPAPINIRCSNLYESCNRSGSLGGVNYDMALHSELTTITLTSGKTYNDCIKTTEEDNISGQVRRSWQCRDVGEVIGEKVDVFISELESITAYSPLLAF